jgi:phage-related minor tail protein
LADNFGLKIGVEGEKEFKNALRDINQAFKVLGSEMALVSSQFDKNDKSIQALTARNEVLEKSIDAQKEKIETLRAALDNAELIVERESYDHLLERETVPRRLGKTQNISCDVALTRLE